MKLSIVWVPFYNYCVLNHNSVILIPNSNNYGYYESEISSKPRLRILVTLIRDFLGVGTGEVILDKI